MVALEILGMVDAKTRITSTCVISPAFLALILFALRVLRLLYSRIGLDASHEFSIEHRRFMTDFVLDAICKRRLSSLEIDGNEHGAVESACRRVHCRSLDFSRPQF